MHGGVPPFSLTYDIDKRIPAGHAAFFNLRVYTTFHHSSSILVLDIMVMNLAGTTESLTTTRWSNVAYWFVFGLGLAWTAQLCLRSTGTQTDDEIGHFLLSRDSFLFPKNLLDLWGRPFITLVYAAPAQGGIFVARLFSLLLTATMVLVTTRLATLLNVRYLFLIPALLWFQPWFMDLGYPVMTEVPFALLLTTGTFFWAAERFKLASCCFGLLPLARDEGLALMGLWFLYMLFRRNWKAAALGTLPLLAFYLLFATFEGVQTYATYLHVRNITYAGSGDWFHFVRRLRFDVGAPVLLLATLGLWSAYRLKGQRRLFTGFLIYFAIHVVIYRFGLFSSGGEARYVMPTAPAFAILGAMGLESIVMIWERLRERIAHRIPSGALPLGIGLVLAGTIVYGIQRVNPRLPTSQSVALRQASDWLKENGLGSRPTVTTNVNFYYFHPLPVEHGSYWWVVPKLADLGEGTIVVWDRKYSNRWGLKLMELEESRNSWRKLASFGSGEIAIVFEKKKDAGGMTSGNRVGNE